MYYDDANIVDSQHARGQGQACFATLAECIGMPFAAEKRQTMRVASTFLGIEHDFSEAHTTGIVHIRPRPKLQEDILFLVDASLAGDRLTPGQASKLRGKVSFAATAMYAKVGRAAMRPLVQREYSDMPPWKLSRTLSLALEYIRELIVHLPPRVILVRPPRKAIVSVASDAQAETNTPSAGAILIAPCLNLSKAAFGHFWESLLSAWGYPLRRRQEGGNCIALCECAVVLFTLWQFRFDLAGRHVLWYVDNTTALHGLCKGIAGNAYMCRMVEAVHVLQLRYICCIWWEYVPSCDNWADGVSRHGFADDIVRQMECKCAPLEQGLHWWTCTLRDIWDF